MTTDITELAQSKALHKKLNHRLNDAFGFQRTSRGKHSTISLSIDECKSVLAALDERFALVEALEKSEKASEARREAVDITHKRAARERDRANAAEEALEKAQTENTASAAGMAESYETTISMLRSRIADLEESHSQVIHARDHYKALWRESLKESLTVTVTVKLPEPFKLAKSSSGLTYYYADEVDAALTAAGIKVEAE